MTKFIKSCLFGGAVILSLSACSLQGAALTAGANAGLHYADDRTASDATKDASIAFQIRDDLFQHHVDLYRFVNVSVFEGRVLLYGNVPQEHMRNDAVRIAWKIEDVKEVINELHVKDSSTLTASTQDTILKTSLKADLTFDGDISSLNYDISVSDGIIYVMGISKTQAEKDKVFTYARNQPYVRKVVDYTRMMDIQEG